MSQTPEKIALERIRQAAESGEVMLDLYSLKLTFLPSEIGKLINLRKLDLGYNQLTSLPSEIGNLTKLWEINLVGNQLKSLPNEIGKLINLRKLDVGYNQLTGLPSEIGNLTELREINLNGNQLTSLPNEIGKFANLTKLDLSNNRLPSLLSEIGELTNLSELDLGGNELTNLPPDIGKLTNLRNLDLGRNQLGSLPPEIGELTNLWRLDFGENKLTDLPPEIGKLKSLIGLAVGGNELTNLPPEIGKLTNLRELDLGGNQLTNLPPDIGKLSNLEKLQVLGSQLTSIPSEIGQLKNLMRLLLSNGQLTSLPPGISKLLNLTELDLSNNQLMSLPVEIGILTNLAELDLSNNRLKSLLPEIGKLANLQKLDLSNNELITLPSEFGELTNLKELHIQSNQLTSLPSEIGELSNLEELHIQNNQLTSLPSEIRKLSKLTELFLQDNQLTKLPPGIEKLRYVEIINLYGNPLEIAVSAKLLGNKDWIGSGYSQKIFINYKQMYEEDGRPLGEARVLVIGEADAGKTKLLRALLRGEHGAAFNDTRDPTDGIDVNSFEADGVSLRFWDFGGQELMHATHRFFLSRRCVYVLVADSTKDSNYNEEKIEYWLELLKFYGGDSPVLLVASKVENFSLNVNERGLQGKYPNLVRMPALRTSAKTGAGIEDLRRAILEQVKSLPSVNVMLPRTFLAVKEALEELKRNEKVKVIEEATFRHLCEENGITEEERQNTLLGLLHDMGVVLHYEDDRLSDFGILNPDWATGGVYKVVNSPQIKESQGRFTLAQLKTILADEELYPASMRRRIVDLMKKFELTFELPFERDAFILPSALPVNQPELSGWEVPCMTFEYRYPILQISVFHRFIVSEHDLIQNGQVWYSGLVIARGENQALVKADTRDKRITIKVKGAEESRKEFLYFIRLQFERIHGEEAEPEEVVYSPQCPSLPLSFDKMKKLLKAGKTEYPEMCGENLVNINLRELLDGFITTEERRKDEEREKLEAKQRGSDKEANSGDTYITNNNITLGNLEGSNFVFGEGHHVQQTVQGSFNAFPAELQNTLVELIKTSELLLQKAEVSEYTEEIKDELESLQTEAKKSKPKKERVKVTVEGLAQAAKNLNDIGKPVFELAMTVIKLINNLPA